MTQYFITYNQEKFQYLVWNNQQVICRVSDIDKKDENWLKVAKFLQGEYNRLKQPLEIYPISIVNQNLDSIMKAVEGIRR